MNTLTIKALMLAIAVSLLNINSFAQDIVFGKAEFIKGNGIDKIAAECLDRNENIYLVGSFEKDGNIEGAKMQNFTHRSMFLAKYNSKGVLLYTKQFGGEGDITVHSMITDSRGNIYISGTFKKSCRFADIELKTKHWQSNFILKLEPNGKVISAKQIDAVTKDEKTFLVCDNKDYLYFGGSFYKTMNVDGKNIESTSGSDIFIAKLNEDLKFVDLHAIHGKNKDIINALAFSEDNRLFIAGTFTDNINFSGKQYISEGRKDIFLAELNVKSDNTNSEYIKQVKQIGSYYNDFPTDILIKNNRLYLLGSFSGTVRFGKEKHVSNGMTDVFLSRYNLNLKELSTITFGGPSDDYARSVVMSEKGNIYVTGSFRGEMKTDKKTVETDRYQTDNFIAVFNPKGNLRTFKNFGGTDNDFPVQTLINSQNVLFHIGSYRNDFKFGNMKTAETEKTKNNIFLTELYDCDNTELNLGDDIEVCGNRYNLDPEINYSTYQWSNGSAEKETEILKTGTYTLNVTDRFGCKASDDINVTLHEIPTIDLGEDIVCTFGDTIILNAEPGFENYSWSLVDSLQELKSSEQQLIINTKDLTEGTYVYSLTATDFKGCFCNDEIKLTVLKKENPVDPNAFSAKIVPNPNNGRFTLYINNPNTKSNILYEIYSPEGKLILKKKAESLKEEINIQTKAEGSYILKIINGVSVLKKVIIVSTK